MRIPVVASRTINACRSDARLPCAALAEEGIAADEIATAGRGKTDLAVPTADGVRNRATAAF